MPLRNRKKTLFDFIRSRKYFKSMHNKIYRKIRLPFIRKLPIDERPK